MIDFLRARHQFYTKAKLPMDIITQMRSGIHQEENQIVTCCAKRNLVLNHYICVVKCLICLMLNILRHMVRGCECKERGSGGVQNCLDNRCQNNKERKPRKSKGYAEKEACDGMYSSRNITSNHSKDYTAKEAPKDCINLDLGSSTFPAYSDSNSLANTVSECDGLILPQNSNECHKGLKTSKSRIQHSPDKNNVSGSEEHKVEIKSLSEVERTGQQNTSNNPSSINDQERRSKYPILIASTSKYEREADTKHDVHHTEDNEEIQLDLDGGSIDNASLETDNAFCWQETDDSTASLRANQKLEDKLKGIFRSANLVKKYGSIAQFSDTLSNDSDKPIRNNSVKFENNTRAQQNIQITTALTDNSLEKDIAELLNCEVLSKKNQLPRNAANRCSSNMQRDMFDEHSDGKKKEYLESAIASNAFGSLYHTNRNACTNSYSAEKTPIIKSVCLENTKMMSNIMQLNDDQICLPMTVDKHHDGLEVVSLKDVLVGVSQSVGMGDQQKTRSGDPDPENENEGGDDSAEGGEGEADGGEEDEGESQEADGDKGGGGGGSEQGGEGGEEGAEEGEGNNYVTIMMRGALGPSLDEAVLDAMDVIKRVGEFVKGSVLKDEEGGGSSETGTEGGEQGGESGEEKGGTEEGGAEGGEEGGAEGGEKGGAEGGEEAGAEGGEEEVAAGGETEAEAGAEEGDEDEAGDEDDNPEGSPSEIKSETELTEEEGGEEEEEEEEDDDDDDEIGSKDLQSA